MEYKSRETKQDFGSKTIYIGLNKQKQIEKKKKRNRQNYK